MVHGQPASTTLRVVASKYHQRGLNATLWLSFICTIGFLTACAAPLAALSSSGTTAASTVGAAAVANPSTAASLASSAATGKSPLEHAASAATKKECSFLNVIDSKPICIEVVLPTVTDKSEPLLGPADSSKDNAKQ
jgi:hypothetical protein